MYIYFICFILAMASLESIVVAGLIHLLLRFTIFKVPQAQVEAPAPSISSYIVCVALLDLIYDSRIVPVKVYRAPHWIKCICESLVAIILLEVGMLIVWSSLEFSIYVIAQTLLLGMDIVTSETYFSHETLIIGSITFPLAVSILAISNHATKHCNAIYRRYFAPKRNVFIRVDDTVTFLNRSNVYKRRRMEEAISKYGTPLWKSYFDKHT